MFVLSSSICASFCGTTNFLSTLAISGLPSFSWTSNASMIVLSSWVDFWIINHCCICNCVLYPHIRWSWGHIPVKVLLSGVLCWVSNLTVSYEVFFLRYRHIFMSPQYSAELLWLRVLAQWWCLLIARRRVSTNIRNRPVILSDHWRRAVLLVIDT